MSLPSGVVTSKVRLGQREVPEHWRIELACTSHGVAWSVLTPEALEEVRRIVREEMRNALIAQRGEQ